MRAMTTPQRTLQNRATTMPMITTRPPSEIPAMAGLLPGKRAHETALAALPDDHTSNSTRIVTAQIPTMYRAMTAAAATDPTPIADQFRREASVLGMDSPCRPDACS